MTYSVDGADGAFLLALANHGSALRRIPLFQKFKWERDATNPNLYDYRIWLSDGRQWTQTLLFSAPVDQKPKETFSVNPGWDEDEFMPHRAWRTLMIRARNDLGCSLLRIDPV
jgi:hypothetical protein